MTADNIQAAMRDWRCAVCKRRPHNQDDILRWNQVYVNGRVVSTLCPEHQTPDETAEAERNQASGDTHRSMCEARLLTADTFRRVCDRAISEGVPAPTDRYLDEHGDTDHLFIPGGSMGTEAVGMAFPFDAPVTLDFVNDPHGEEIPLVDANAFLAEDIPHIVLAVPLTEIIGAPMIVVREGWLQAEITEAVTAYLTEQAEGGRV
jgi:hypothetical protein